MPMAPNTPLNAIESAKRAAARLAVKEHFPSNATYIGIGSGSTIVHVVDAILDLHSSEAQNLLFIPTGYQSRQVILKAGLKDIKFDSLPEDAWIDVAFDGADEVDEDLNCIKGGGACLYQEKLVAMRARKFICVADHRKLKPKLLSSWPTIPIEVEPLAAQVVIRALRQLGSTDPFIREGSINKAGPIKTDQDNYLVDAGFPAPLLVEQDSGRKGDAERGKDGAWEVKALAREIKMLTGVVEVGLFYGMNGQQAQKLGGIAGGQKPVAAYFGMEDGGVLRRVAQEDGSVVEEREQPPP